MDLEGYAFRVPVAFILASLIMMEVLRCWKG